jgi:membrane protein required for colicin V production
MNWVDILVLVGWGLVALWGFKVGLIRMVVPLVVVVVGLALSSRIAEPVGDFFSFISENENVQTVAAFIAILIVLLVIGALLSSLLRTAIGIIPLAGLVNNLAGAGIGILIGFIILSGLLTGLQKIPMGGIRADIAQSSLGTFLADNFDVVTRGFRLIPGDWDERVKGLTESLQEKINEFKKDATKAGPVSITNVR